MNIRYYSADLLQEQFNSVLSDPEKEDQTNWFYWDVLGGFDLGTHIEGSIPYINPYYIILLHASYSVYVVGNVSYKLLRNTLPHYTKLTDIRDISIFIYPRFLESWKIPDVACITHHLNTACWLKVVKNFCSENFFIHF